MPTAPPLSWLQSFIEVGLELILGLAFYTATWLVACLCWWEMFPWLDYRLYYFLVVWALLSMYLDYKVSKVIDK